MPLNNVFCGWNKKILQVLYFTGACYIAFCCVMTYSHHWLGIIKSWGSLGLFNTWKNISRAVIKHYLSRSGWLQTYSSINPILGLLTKKTASWSFHLQTTFLGGVGGDCIFHPGESDRTDMLWIGELWEWCVWLQLPLRPDFTAHNTSIR